MKAIQSNALLTFWKWSKQAQNVLRLHLHLYLVGLGTFRDFMIRSEYFSISWAVQIGL